MTLTTRIQRFVESDKCNPHVNLTFRFLFICSYMGVIGGVFGMVALLTGGSFGTFWPSIPIFLASFAVLVAGLRNEQAAE